MPYENISATLSSEEVNAIKAKIKAAREAMPFLIALTGSESQRRYKMGRKRLAFVEAAVNAAKDNAEILPSSFNVAEFEKDFKLCRALDDVRSALKQLLAEVNGTTVAVGSEAAKAATRFLKYAKTAADTEPGLQSVVDRLSDLLTQANDAPDEEPVA